MKKTQELWRSYNLISKLLKEELNRTANLVGEYAEYLIAEYTSGELLEASSKGADVISDAEELYQVKSRKLSDKLTGALGIIRSWDFHFLAVVIFDDYGDINKAFIVRKDIAKKYSKQNDLQNGWVITMTQEFINNKENKDITEALKMINLEKVIVKDQEGTKNSKSITSNIPIGAYVRMRFSDIVDNNLLNTSEIENLQKKEYSKSTFDIQYPFLRKVKLSDNGKIERYWKNPILIKGNKFYLCSEWHENNNNNDRPFFEKWLKKMVVF